MFLAITFMCLTSGECNFIHDNELTTKAVCEERNAKVGEFLESDPNVSAYRTICVPVPEFKQA
jgi:hypothetical protein